EIKHAWLVDPVLRTLEVLRLERGRWVLLDTYHDDARVHAEPFEVFELELDVLWAGVQLPAPPR
ncbi:MAG: Uma2 family endonuclease, partial [Kofleriaceae bacterium]